MATISRVTTWSDGQTLTAAALNGEFNNILNDYNGNITNANISASAAISTSKINATFPSGTIVGTTDVQVLTSKTLTSPTINTPIFSTGAINVSGLGTVTTNFTSNSTSYTDLTGATASITVAVTSNILVILSGEWRNDGLNTNFAQLLRGSTVLVQGQDKEDTVAAFHLFNVSHLDTSVAAGTYTYKAQVKVDAGNITVAGAAAGGENTRIMVLAFPV